MNQFVLADCTTESGALAQLSQNAKDGIVVKAGGVDLLDRMKEGLETPNKLVNIRNISSLRGIRETPEGLHIGPLTTLTEISEHPLIQSQYTIFCRCVWQCGDTAYSQYGDAGRKSAAGKSLLVFSLEGFSMPA